MAKTQMKNITKKDLNASFLSMKEEIYDALSFIFQKDCIFSFIDFLSKWHHYSVYNVILLYKQFPDATYLASYKRWKELSALAGNGPYHTILKSEHKQNGISLLIPFSLYRMDFGPKERFLSYHPIHVFDASQVNEISYPEPFTPFVAIRDLTFQDFLSILRGEEKENIRFVPIKEAIAPTIQTQKDAFFIKDTIYYSSQAAHRKEALFYAYIGYVTHTICQDKNFTASEESFIYRAAARSLYHFYVMDSPYQLYDDTRLLLDLEAIHCLEKEEQLLLLHYIQLVIKTCIYRIKSGFSVQLATNFDNESERILKQFL